MIISESHNFIFLAVPKTGTSSIERALARYRSPLTDRFRKHATCKRVRQELPEKFWQSAFKFAFVRNPYDRMQSWYYYRKREELANPEHPRHHLYTGDKTFDQFVESFAERDWMLLQLAWVAPPALGGGSQLDFIGRFEHLDEDYRHVCEQVDVPYSPLPTIRGSSNDASARSLWSRESRRRVNEYFRRDFELFGYEMLDE